MHDTADAHADTGDGSWMTYSQLAQARQIGRRAAIRLAQRHHLRRQPGNDGSVRVWVPADMATSSPFRPFPPATPNADVDDSQEADARLDPTPPQTQALATLESALRAADARADAAIALADKLADELADAGDRAGRAETRAAHAEQRATEAEARIAAKDSELAEQRLAAVQARVEAQEAIESAQRDAKAAQAELAVAGLFADQTRAEAEEARQAAAARIARLEAMTQALVVQAEADADRARGVVQEAVQAAETLQAAVDELRVGQGLMQDVHARELAVAQHDAQAAQQSAAELRQADDDNLIHNERVKARVQLGTTVAGGLFVVAFAVPLVTWTTNQNDKLATALAAAAIIVGMPVTLLVNWMTLRQLHNLRGRGWRRDEARKGRGALRRAWDGWRGR